MHDTIEAQIELPDELKELANQGLIVLYATDEDGDQYDIPELRHRTRTWHGWGTVTYTLWVYRRDDDAVTSHVDEESEGGGSREVLNATEADEAACWIEERGSKGRTISQ